MALSRIAAFAALVHDVTDRDDITELPKDYQWDDVRHIHMTPVPVLPVDADSGVWVGPSFFRKVITPLAPYRVQRADGTLLSFRSGLCPDCGKLFVQAVPDAA